MQNYFYDILPIELQKYIIKLAEREYIKGIYRPWNIRNVRFGDFVETYRCIDTNDNKFWYFDSIIVEKSNGGCAFLKMSESNHKVNKIYECLHITDEIRLLKDIKLFGIQRKMKQDIVDDSYDEYVGNYWGEGYESPIDDHLNIANHAYALAIDV